MAVSVGSVPCDLVAGKFRAPTSRVETWQRLGMDGYGARDLGKGNSSFRVRIFKEDTAENIDIWIAAIQDLADTIVSIVDDWGITTTDCIIQQIGEPRKTPVHIPGTGDRCWGVMRLAGVIDS